ncbi:armadillo-type protein [Catenaria anguillulae PL171]|uniref:Armadillo-type protein n=1 Tax=Catenaria anguillulae PL171 TaxID=765915 RepID=A0A1Y2HPS4_9FUNG|nr:armadillo-type protein [Catenaria anguillulae PL171]
MSTANSNNNSAASGWQPDPAGLAKLVDLLHGGSSADNLVQRRVQQEISQLGATVPDFACYLAHILSSPNDDAALRTIAGFALKSYLINYLPNLDPHVLHHVKTSVLANLGDPSPDVNKVTGTLISYLLAHLRVEGWPEAPRRLAELLAPGNDESHPAFHAALSTVFKTCEDDADDLLTSPTQPLSLLLPHLIRLVTSPKPKLAAIAINCMTELSHGETPLMQQVFPTYLAALFSRALDADPTLRKSVCMSICRVLENKPEVLEPQLNDIMRYMLTCTQQQDDDELALEACEFWLVLGESDEYVGALGAYLEQLVPVLVQRMVYSENEIIDLGGDEDDAHVPDSEQEIKPRHYRGKSGADMSTPTPTGGDGPASSDTEGGAGTGGAGGDDDEDDDDDDDQEVANSWTVRKCAAATLDMIAGIYQTDILPVRKLDLVRARPQYLPGFVDALMANCVHRNKKVQEAACSALATLEEAAGSALAHYLPRILPVLTRCLNEYQRKNMLVLYDCIGTLAESLHNDELKDPALALLLVDPMLAKFNAVSDLTPELLPLYEALAAVAIASGMAFVQHSKHVFERCMQVIHQTYVAAEQVKQGVAGYQADVINILKMTLAHPHPAVRQSALGLFGDLVINCYIHVKSSAPELLHTAIQLVQLVEEKSWLRLANNAIWVCAELTTRMGADMAPYVPALWDRLLSILCNHYGSDHLPVMLAENCALAAGRLGHVAPELLAKDLTRFGAQWCMQMVVTREGVEKEASFLGFLKVVQCNPQGLVPHLPRFIEAVLHYATQSATTEEPFRQVLAAYKGMLGEEQWGRCLAMMPQQGVHVLAQRFPGLV